ncbi:MAG TPA: Gfo/Idh/MocA family oxidoreductase [Candidatus Acidoferrales bacterium]|nr:Gfo/Idh/MocA family oxidoreductase [Candidatus Acidoferrales bacterium]
MKTPHSLTRRSFIKIAGLAGAAPMFLRSGLWAADTAPSKQFALGFIGVGKQGDGLLHACLPRNDVRVLAVCDVDTTRRDLAKNAVEKHYADEVKSGAYKGCDTYGDFRELLARPDIDAVVIATPDHWHALVSIAAAKAGKDIYCEKPMAHTVREGRAMVEAVRKHHRIFQTGSMQRSMAEFRAACELVRNGVLGTVARVDASVSGPPKFCDLPAEPDEPGLDWNLWLGPAPQRPYNSILSPRGMPKDFPAWRNYREYAGGGVCDWGAHHFDIVQWAFGYDDSGPVEFYAADKPDAQSGVRWRYPNGAEVTHQPGNGIVFYGDKGKLHVNRGQFQLWLGDQLKAEVMDDYSPLLKELLPANAVRLYHSTNQLSDWIKCMETRKLPICDVEIGQRSATVCNLVNAVYFGGQGFKWNPQAEKFAEGTGAPHWLTREYRMPWRLA